MELIYLDNAATTRTDERVVEAMLPYFTQYYGNASTIYALGEESRKAVTRARDIIAAGIGAKPEEIYFTAGGSESDNWALKATAEAYKEKGKHIITSKIEHHAIGSMVPISLLANIIEIRMVSGRIAASTSAGLIHPFSSTSR